jgi:DNA-binding NarL/FixJ family response regulator
MATEGGTQAVPLLGRRRERELLDRLVTDVATGTSRVLVLRGEPGVGKSALLAHVARQTLGWRVVSAAGVESEMELAYSGLHQLCRPLLTHLDDLPGPQRDALATVFGLTFGPPPDRFLVGLATLSLLAEAAESGPLACIVDDAQWLDRASGQVLAFVSRRLDAERVALVCAARTGRGDDALIDLPTLPVGGLSGPDARTLLLSNLHAPLDSAVTARIVAESQGNPLALLELPRTWTAAALAGGFTQPGAGRITGRIEHSYVRRLRDLPADTQLLALTAAADPLGDPLLLRRAADELGLDITSVEPAVDAGLLRLGGRVAFAHPLVRSATYRTATTADRRRAHHALAAATDAATDPDRHAWHRACAAPLPDEDVADELERSADRAQTRGGFAAAAAFLTRATELTPDPGRRTGRAVAAALANLRAGAFDTARTLLSVAEAGSADPLQLARMDLVRAQTALVSRRAKEAAPLLLSAARRLDALDPDLARRTYLDAFSAAQFCARLNDAVPLTDLAVAARTAARLSPAMTAGDLLLLAYAELTEDYATAVPRGREALAGLRADGTTPGSSIRLLWQGSVLALELWDDGSANVLSKRHLELVRASGALSELPLALSSWIPVLVFRGELTAAAALVEEARSVQEAAGVTEAAYGALTHGAWRGQERLTRELIAVKMREARARGEGIGIAVCEYARAVLCNGLGQFEEAHVAALGATDDPRELVVHNWGLVELVESAARIGKDDQAEDAVERLAVKARAAGTEWSLGIEARCRALVSTGASAEAAFRQAIAHLGRAQVRAELARAHLLYGEWLRQADRRLDARAQLTLAHATFADTGLEAFQQRARRELLATGMTVRAPAAGPCDDLSPQEAHIARLARDGMSNPEIGAQLFLSARTVEWHLRKVFTKLGITSRRELRRALTEHDRRA